MTAPVEMSRDRSNVTALLDETPSYSRQNQGGICLVIKGPDRGEQVRIDASQNSVSFGSGPQCTLVLTDKTVSRKHLEAQLVGDEVMMIDCGSTNGTVVSLPDGAQVLCPAGQRVLVPWGGSVAFGQHTFDVVRG